MPTFLKGLFLPSTLVFFLGVVGFLLLKFDTGKATYFALAGVLFFYFFSVTPVSDGLLGVLESPFSRLNREEILKSETGKIVVLTGGREANIIRSSEALRIFHVRNGDAEIIVSGSKPPEDGLSEVKKFFINRGVPSEKVTLEEDSDTTRENIENIMDKLDETPFFLVTSGYHMKRTMEEINRKGLEARPAPVGFKSKGEYGVVDFFPNSYNLRKSELAIYEHLGRVYYAISSD